jgi:predicted dehydrogenase
VVYFSKEEKMVKVGILGTGFMGSMHAEVYRNLPNAELVAVADRNLDKVLKLAGRYGATAYSTAEDLFDKEKISVVDYPEVQQPLVAAANTEGNIAQLGGYFSEIKYFVDSVENDREPVQAGARAARDSLEVALAEKESAETGKIIKIGKVG